MPEVETIRVVIPESKIVKINVLLPGGTGGATFGPQTPHYIFAGPPSGALLGIPSFRPAVEDDLPFAAMLDKPNVFTRENTIPGLRIGTRTITADYSIQATDFEILADATAGNITVALPSALATGQIFRVKRVDATGNTVTVLAQSTDLIDGQSSVLLSNQYDDVMVFDAGIGVWDKFSSIGGSVLPSDLARLSVHNLFTNVNTFTGVQYSTKTVTSDYILTPLDYEVLVDASAGPITVSLPSSIGSGQVYHVKKIDDTDNIVTIAADGTDLIDGSITVNLPEQWADLLALDASTGYWDNLGGAPLDIPPTIDIARLSLPNVFTALNTFTGLRISTKTVTSNYTILTSDYEVLVDASSNNVLITLPAATATGQLYRVKRIDSVLSNTVTIQRSGADLIDGSSFIELTDQYQVATFVDAASGFWDKGLFGGGADFGINGRVRDLNPIKGFAFDVFDGASWIEQVRYVEPSTGPTPTTRVSYWYNPDITLLTDLKAWPTIGNLLDSRMDALYNAGSNISGQLAVYLLKTGAAAGGDPGQVAPNDYNASTNNVHWLQVL